MSQTASRPLLVTRRNTTIVYNFPSFYSVYGLVCSRWVREEGGKYPGRVSWGGGGGLVVMKDHHDEEPVAAAEVPDHPGQRVGAEDGGQDEQVNDDHNRGGEKDDETDEHLRDRKIHFTPRR